MNIVDKYVTKPKVKKHKSSQNQGSWLGNVMRSLGYSGIDVLEELAPSTVDFVKTTMDVGQDMYTALNNAKSSDRTLKNALEKNYYIGLGKDIFKNSLADLKSGKINNKQRAEEFINQNSEDDFGDFGDFGDMGFGDDEDFDSTEFDDFSDSIESSDGDTVATFSRKKAGNNEITHVSVNTNLGPDSTLVQATNYQTETNINVGKALVENTKVQNRAVVHLLATMNNSFGSALVSMSENVTQMTSVVTENLSQHTSVSAKYFQDSISLQQQILEHLKDNLQKNPTDQMNTKKFKDRLDVMDLFSMGGALDLNAYKELVKKNFDTYSNENMILSALKMVGDNKETLGWMAANPLGSLVTGGLKALIPQVIKTSLGNFDKQLKETMIAGLGQISGLGNSSNPILSAIGKLFGVRSKISKNIDKSEYNKGAMSWTGIDHQALTNVIPTLLRKIYATVSGTQEIGFDYNAGVFKKVADIEKEQKEKKRDRETSEFADVRLDYKNFLKERYKNLSSKEIDELLEKMDKLNANLSKDNTGGKHFRKGGYFGKGDRDDLVSLLGATNDDATEVKTIRAYYKYLYEHNRPLLAAIFGSKQEAQRSRIDRDIRAIQNDPTRFNSIYMDTGLTGDLATDAHLKHDNKNNKYEVTGVKSGLALGSTDKYGKTSLFYLRNILQTLNTGIYVVPVDTSTTILGEKYISKNKDTQDDETDGRRTARDILDDISKRSYNVSDIYAKDKDKLDRTQKTYVKKNDYSESKRKEDEKKGKLDPRDENQQVLSADAMNAGREANTESNTEDRTLIGKALDYFSEDTGIYKLLNNIRKKTAEGGGKISKVLDTLSEGLFAIVFGAEEERKGIGGLFRKAMDLLKSNFKKFGRFLDDKVIKPLNEALFGDDGLVTKIKESEFGKKISNFFKDMTSKAGSFLLGDKDANGKRQGGLFSETVESLKDIGGKVKDGIFGEKGPDGKPLPLDQDNSIFGGLKRIFNATGDSIKDSLGLDKTKKPFITRLDETFDKVTNRISQRASDWGNVIFGPDDENNTKLNSVFDSEFSKKFKEDLQGQKGYIGATASIGMLSSFFLPGGPIGGALLGAGYGIVKKSTGIQEFLFGPEDANGERHAGLIIKEVQDFFNKHKFGMGAGAIGGLLSSVGLLPSFFLPGGPIGGALIGTGVSLIAKSDAFNDLLYGPGGTKDDPTGGIGKKFKDIFGKDKTSKGLSIDAGIGAGVGLIGSFFLPGGPLLGALVGSITSVATATDKFRDWFFGDKDENGKRKGGVLGKFKDKFSNFLLGDKDEDGKRKGGILGQFTTSIKLAQTYIGEFIETQMILPFKLGMKPLVEDAKRIGNKIKTGVSKLVSSIKDKVNNVVIKPVGDAFKKYLINPMKKFFTGLFKGFGKLVGTIISAPFKAVEGLGNLAYNKHKRQGKRAYRKDVNKNLNPFNRANWGITEEDDTLRKKIGKIAGAGKRWFKAATDEEALYNAQFSDKGAWYDRDYKVKKPERDRQTKANAHNKWADRRRDIRGGYEPTDDNVNNHTGIIGSFLKSLEGHESFGYKTWRNRKGISESADSGKTRVKTVDPEKERRKELKNKYKAAVDAGYTGEKLRREVLGRKGAKQSSAKSGFSFGTWANEYDPTNRYKPGSNTTNDTKVDTSIKDPDVSEIRTNTSSILDLLSNKFNGVLDFLGKIFDSTKGSSTPKSSKVDTSDSYNPKDSRTSESGRSDTLLDLIRLIQKDVSKTADSVYGQLNGVGSNINKIYKSLIKKFGYEDNDIKGDNNKSYVGFFGRIRTALNNPVKAVKNFFMSPINKIRDAIGSPIKKIKNIGSAFISGIKDVGLGLISSVADLGTTLKNKVGDLKDKILEAGSSLVSTIKKKLPELGNKIKEAGATLVDTVKTNVPKIIDKVKKTGKAIGGKFIDVSLTIMAGVSLAASNLKDTLKEKIPQIGQNIKEAGSNLFEHVKSIGNSLKEQLGTFKDKFKDFMKGTWDNVKGIFKTGLNVGKTLLSVPFNAIKNKFGGGGKGFGLFKKGPVHVIVDSGVLDKVKYVNKVGTVKKLGGGSTDVPHLASGAVIPPNKKFLAVLGDQKEGTNVETPLSTIKQAVTEVLDPEEQIKKKKKDDRIKQAEKGSRESILARLNQADNQKEEENFKSKILNLLGRSTTATEEHKSSFFKVFDIKKGLITAGLITLAPILFKFFKKFNIGGIIGGIASGISTGFKEIGGVLGLLYNGKEVYDQINGVVTGSDTHYKVDENGNLVYDENGKLETETTKSSRVLEALMPINTRVNTDTGEFANQRIWTGTSDSVVNFGANRIRNRVLGFKKLRDKVKGKIDVAKGRVGKIKAGSKKLFDYATSKSDKLTNAYIYADDAFKAAKTAVKNKAATTFDAAKSTAKVALADDSKGIGKAVGFMKQAITLLVDKFTTLGKKFGVKITESSFGSILNKVKGVINAGKLAKNSSIAGKITKFLAKWSSKAVAAASTALLSEAGFFLVGAVSGACNAGALFEVDPKNVDAKMRAIAGVFKGLLSTSIGSWVDLINSIVYELLGVNFVKEIATAAYKLFSSDKKDKQLEDAQKQFTEDYEAYVDKEYEAYVENAEASGEEVMSKEDFIAKGLATTRSEYNAKTNKSLAKRAVDTVQKVGKGVKKVGKTVVNTGKSVVDTTKSTIKGSKNIIKAAFSGDMNSFSNYSVTKENGDTSVVGNAILGVQKTLMSPIALTNSIFKNIEDKLFDTSDFTIDSVKNSKTFMSRLYKYTDPKVKIDGWEKETITGDKGNIMTNLISSVVKKMLWLPINLIRTVRSIFGFFTDLFDSDDDNDTEEDTNKSSKSSKKKKGIFSKLKDKIKGLFGGNGGNDGGHPIYGMGGDNEYYYSQNDPKYKNKQYKQTGVNTSTDDTMGESGCGPTAMAMVASKMSDKKYDPMDMAKMSEAGGYSTSLGTSPEYFNAAANTLGIPSSRSNPSVENLQNSLASGNSVILQGVKSSGTNSPFTSQGHYVVANGMGGDTVNISDPRGREYSGQYKLSDVMTDSTSMWSFGGKGVSKHSPRNIIRRVIKGGKGGDTDKWISIVKAVKKAIAAQSPGYNQSGSVTISVDGKSLKVRTDCSGFVSACLKYFGVLDEGTNLSSRDITDTNNTTMKGTGFTPGSWPGWDSLQEGDILALNGHTEIFAYNDGDKHYVYNCGSNSSVNNPNATYTAHKEGYSTIWRCGAAGSLSVSGTDTEASGSSSTSFSSLSDVFSQMGSVFSNSVLNSLGVKTEDTSSDSSDGSVSAKDINLSGNNYASQIWNYLTNDEGLTAKAASGVMGCWQKESGNNPTTVEGYYLPGYPGYEKVMADNTSLDDYTTGFLFSAYDRSGTKINKSGYKADDGHYYPGIGLAQWTAGRAAKLKKFADSNGKDWRKLDTQLNFFSDYPGEFGDRGLKTSMNAAKTTDEATQIFAKKYEGSAADADRKNNARQIYQQFDGGGKGGNDGGKPIKTVSTRRTPKNTISPISSSMKTSSDGIDKIVQNNTSKSMSVKETSQLLNTMIQYLSMIADNTEGTSNGIDELNNKDFGSTQNINNITNNNVSNNTESKAKGKSTSVPADRSKYNMAKRVAAGILY